MIYTLEKELQLPGFTGLVRQFLHNQLHSSANSTVRTRLPDIRGRLSVYASAVAIFHAPSDLSGIGGMRHERIRAVSSWRRGPAQYDCVFIKTKLFPVPEGMRGLDIGRIRLFFSFNHGGVEYPCALIHRYSRVGNTPDVETGMWIVEPDVDAAGLPTMAVIHLNTIIRAAHLLGVCGAAFLPKELSFNDSLDAFHNYYVNKFIDHHAFEIAF
jgi:hypothetical protein